MERQIASFTGIPICFNDIDLPRSHQCLSYDPQLFEYAVAEYVGTIQQIELFREMPEKNIWAPGCAIIIGDGAATR